MRPLPASLREFGHIQLPAQQLRQQRVAQGGEGAGFVGELFSLQEERLD